jgi:formate hydrogenlyase subunit 4
MPVIQLIVVLVVIGVLMWLVNTYVPMADPYKKILNVVVIIAVVLWLLSVFGVFSGLGSMTVGPHHG